MQNYKESSKFSLHESYRLSTKDVKFFGKVKPNILRFDSKTSSPFPGCLTSRRTILSSPSRILHHALVTENGHRVRDGERERNELQVIEVKGVFDRLCWLIVCFVNWPFFFDKNSPPLATKWTSQYAVWKFWFVPSMSGRSSSTSETHADSLSSQLGDEKQSRDGAGLAVAVVQQYRRRSESNGPESRTETLQPYQRNIATWNNQFILCTYGSPPCSLIDAGSSGKEQLRRWCVRWERVHYFVRECLVSVR